MVQPQGAMAQARCLLLILLLLVALHARAARAAPRRAQGADEAGGSGYPASRLDVGLEPLEHPGAVPVGEGDAASRPGPGTEPAGDAVDVPAGRDFPAPRLRPGPESGGRRRGPPRTKNPAEGGKKSLKPSDNVKKILQELERGHGTDREAARETAFPKRSSGPLPASAAEAEATRAPSTPVTSKPGQDNRSRADSGVVGKKTATVSPLESIAGVFCRRDVRTFCMLSAVALAVSVAAALLLCCTWVRRWWRRKERASAASGHWLETGGHPSHPRSRTSRPGTPESQAQRQQLLHMPGSPVCSPSSESLSSTPPSSPSPAAVNSHDSRSTSPSSLSPEPPCHFSPSLAVVTPYNPSNTSSSPPPSRSPSPFSVAVMVHPPPSNPQPLKPPRRPRPLVRPSDRD